MQVFTTVSEVQNHLARQKVKTIGFVPTMGALHVGHLSLVKESKKKCDLTVVSIFVNPTQFAPHEDLTQYPRPIENDKKLLEKEFVDILFLPSVKEIYPQLKSLPQGVNGGGKFQLPTFTKILEGKTRPTHFLGVIQVVKRLFEIMQPTNVFFGQKDFQQTLIIKWLIETFDFKIKLHVCQIIREKDGLALSSRNQYLSPEEKKAALILKQTFNLVQKLLNQGEKNIAKIEEKMRKNIEKEPLATLDYAVIRNKKDLSEQTVINQNSITLIAVKIGNTRLIDNLVLKSPLGIKIKL